MFHFDLRNSQYVLFDIIYVYGCDLTQSARILGRFLGGVPGAHQPLEFLDFVEHTLHITHVFVRKHGRKCQLSLHGNCSSRRYFKLTLRQIFDLAKLEMTSMGCWAAIAADCWPSNGWLLQSWYGYHCLHDA